MTNIRLSRVILIIGAVVGILIPESPASAGVTVQQLTAAKHCWLGNDISIENTEALFDAASALLITDNSGPDVSCQLSFLLDGYIHYFYYTDGDINTPQEVNLVLNGNVPGAIGYVRIVDSITYCSGTGSGIVGCANNQRLMMTNEAYHAAYGPNVLAHEFGHTVGLSHSSDPDRIMYYATGTSRDEVTSTECNAYQMEDLSSNGGPSGVIDPNLIDEPADFSDIAIEDLAVTGFMDSIPSNLEDFYDSEDVEILKQMLADPDQEKNHYIIMGLIGLIGDGSDDEVEVLMDYVPQKKDKTEINLNKGIALGTLFARTGNEKAFRYLEKKSKNGKNQHEKEGAVLGLGLSGDSRALALLEDSVDGPRAAGIDNDIIDLAINDNLVVSEVGLRGYYHKEKKEKKK